MVVHFEYHAPDTIDEILTQLHEFGSDAKILAGGTDLMIQMERGAISPAHIISIDRIPHIDALTVNGTVTLGAGTTYRQLEKTPALYGSHLALIEASRQVGGVQVRNVGTIAGNLCNASPAADSAPPLLVMDARLMLLSQQGKRSVPLNEFFTGYRQTVLGAEEILHQIEIPAMPQQTYTVFLKAGRRQAMEISIVSVAVRLTFAGERCQTARIALGAAAPTPIRATDAERLLEGQVLNADLLKEAAYLAVRIADPISDVRASAEYRKHLVEVMVQRACQRCIEQNRRASA